MRDACNVRTACVADWIERPVMAGDVNLDSTFDASDIQIILKIAKGTYNFNGKQRNVMMEAADLNNDGKVTLDDWNMAWDERNYNTTIPGTCGKQRFLTNVGNWN